VRTLALLLLSGSLSASVADNLRQFEGIRLSSYLDTTGHWTVGYGHRCAEGARVTLMEAEALLSSDIAEAGRGAKKVFPSFASHPQHVQDVLVEMVFQIGAAKALTFKRFGAAIAASDYARAGREMLDSRWHKQTPWRVRALVAGLNQS
jgi:GH24 family phage-related lysozyme (muramidase)